MEITLCGSSFIMTDVHLWGEKFRGVEMAPTFGHKYHFFLVEMPVHKLIRLKTDISDP